MKLEVKKSEDGSKRWEMAVTDDEAIWTILILIALGWMFHGCH